MAGFLISLGVSSVLGFLSGLGTGGGSLGRRLENMPARHIDVTPQGGFYTAFLTEEIHLGMQSAQRQTVEARLLLGSAPKGLA